MARQLGICQNTNSVVIPSVRQSKRQNISIERKWSCNSTAQTCDVCGRICGLSFSVADLSKTLRISEVEVLFPTFTTWGRPVRKSRTQLHRAGFRPRAPSLMISLEGTMVLNAELNTCMCPIQFDLLQ